MLLGLTHFDPLDEQSGQRWFLCLVPTRQIMEGRVEWTGGKNMVGINSSGQRIEMNWEEGPSPVSYTHLTLPTNDQV